MTVDWTHFTPWTSLAGGLLIGAAAAMLVLLNGRVAGFATLVVAGLAVGIGTSYGSGCTSGHGVCGISRLSPRSLVATAAFMLAGMATVFLWRRLA